MSGIAMGALKHAAAVLAAFLSATTITGIGDAGGGIPGQATFELNPDGFAYKTESDGVGGSTRTAIFQWLTGALPASAYEAIATTVSGTAGTGTIGSGVNLGSTQTWTRTRIPAGSVTWVIGVTIRVSPGGATLAGPTNMTLAASA